MPIYLGVDGVTREAVSAECERGIVGYHATDCLVGKDGVARSCLDWTAGLDHFEVVPVSAFACDTDTEGNDTNYLYAIAEVLKYCTITITDNAIGVQCTTTGKYAELRVKLYAVFVDGHKIEGGSMHAEESNVCDFDVRYTLSNSNGSGSYYISFVGQPLYSDYFNNYVSGTAAVSYRLGAYSEGTLGVGIKSGRGPVLTQETYLSARVGGKSYPIKVINNLDSLP